MLRRNQGTQALSFDFVKNSQSVRGGVRRAGILSQVTSEPFDLVIHFDHEPRQEVLVGDLLVQQ
jgi:hypothetical protein